MKKNISRTGFIKRIAVIVYDALLLAGVLFFCLVLIFGVPLYIFKSTVHLDTLDAFPTLKLLVSALVIIVSLLIAFIFYGWFWVNGGQTLGMKAWNLYLVNEEGKYITWKVAAIRFMTAIASWACIGMGFAYILVSRKNLAWHDMASRTQIIRYKQSRRPIEKHQKANKK